MQALLLTIFLPIIPLLIWKRYNRDRRLTMGEWILRYVLYLMVLLFLTVFALALFGDDGTSFILKMDTLAGFALKYVCMQVLIVLGIAAAEWLYAGQKVTVKVNWEQFSKGKVIGFLRRYICPYLLYVLALFVVVLNVSMVCDNAVWGDEAFTGITVKNNVYGIMQVLFYWDSHPPLYYLWLKIFGDLFGHTVTVYHAASLVPFLGGILMAVTLLRKHFGKVPAAFFVMVSGLGAACIQYNLEVRMYSLTFAGLAFASYCAYRVISAGEKKAWISMVAWGLAAAYSHYYGLVAAGILVFCTGVAVWLKYRGKTWKRGLCAVIAFLVGYTPWLIFMYLSMGTYGAADLWITEILGLDKCLDMVWGGIGMSKLLLPLFLFIIVGMLIYESGMFRFREEAGQTVVRVEPPSVKGWSDEMYFVVIGAATIAGTLLFGYLVSVLFSPLLVERYLYPLCAVALVTLTAGLSGILKLFDKLGKKLQLFWADGLGKAVLMLVLAVLLVAGIKNYKNYHTIYHQEKTRTDLTLETIGKPHKDVKMVTVGVRHLGWTVLEHYYPENEIVNGDYNSVQCDEFWYFVMPAIDENGLQELKNKGYDVTHYGLMHLSQYPFELYHVKQKN